jgi:hypothetical protein
MRSDAPLLIMLCACDGGPGIVSGTVQSNALIVGDSAFVSAQEIWLSSTTGLCSSLKANNLPKDGTLLKLIPHPVDTGDFTVNDSQATAPDHSVFLQFFKLDDNCIETLMFGQSVATAGTTTITRLDTTRGVTGTFDVTFGSSDHVTGSVNATFCDAPTLYPSPTCK